MKVSINWTRERDEYPNKGVEVIGWLAPHGSVNSGEPDMFVWDGEEWRDRNYRTCTVSHWVYINKPESN